MNTDDVVEQILSEDDAIRSGHFVMASYHHSATYLDLDKLKHENLKQLCDMLAERIYKWSIPTDVVVGPESGGVHIAKLTASSLSSMYGRRVRWAVASKESDENDDVRYFFTPAAMELVCEGGGVTVVDDVMSSGRTLRKVFPLLRKLECQLLGAAVVCKRYSTMLNELDIGAPAFFTSLLDKRIRTYDPKRGACPLCEENKIPVDQTVGRGKLYIEQQLRAG